MNQPCATIVCDSISEAGIRLITLELAQPRMLFTTTSLSSLRSMSSEVDDLVARSNPRLRSSTDWHLPYIDADVVEDIIIYVLQRGPDSGLLLADLDEIAERLACWISVARCQRLSWTSESVEADIAAYRDIRAAKQWQHLKHQALPDHRTDSGAWARKSQHGDLRGWRQFAAMPSVTTGLLAA